MINLSNTKMEFEDFYDLCYKYPHLKNQVALIECNLSLHKFDDVLKCNTAAEKLNRFFEGDVLNAVTFQHQSPDEANLIKGSFTASIPLSEKNFKLFLDLLTLNLKHSQTIVFDDKMIIRTETEKFIINQKIVLNPMDKRT